MKNTIYVFLFLLGSAFLNANETIQIQENQYFIDQEKKMILSNLSTEFINSTWMADKTQIQLDELYTFLEEIKTIKVGEIYAIKNTVTQEMYQLHFTELPIISITTDFTIVDEPDVLGNLNDRDQSKLFRILDWHSI